MSNTWIDVELNGLQNEYINLLKVEVYCERFIEILFGEMLMLCQTFEYLNFFDCIKWLTENATYAIL